MDAKYSLMHTKLKKFYLPFPLLLCHSRIVAKTDPIPNWLSFSCLTLANISNHLLDAQPHHMAISSSPNDQPQRMSHLIPLEVGHIVHPDLPSALMPITFRILLNRAHNFVISPGIAIKSSIKTKLPTLYLTSLKCWLYAVFFCSWLLTSEVLYLGFPLLVHLLLLLQGWATPPPLP